jgi:hypothetical protein
MIITKEQADEYIRKPGEWINFHSETARIFPANPQHFEYKPFSISGLNLFLYAQIGEKTLPAFPNGFERMLLEDAPRVPITLHEIGVTPQIICMTRKSGPYSGYILGLYKNGLAHYLNTPLEILAGTHQANSHLFDIALIRDPREGGIAHFNADRFPECATKFQNTETH